MTQPFRFLTLFFPILATALLLGCQKSTEEQKAVKPAEPKTDNRPITIVILEKSEEDHQDLRSVIVREFKALDLGAPSFVSATYDQFLQQPLEGDLVLYPPHLFGDLVYRDLLRPIPGYIVESEPYRMSDVLRNQRRIFCMHRKERYATSLGVTSLMLLCRTDVLKANGLEVPTTWNEYESVCLKLATARKNGSLKGMSPDKTWSPTIEPLASRWKATTMLARSASSVRSRNRYSVCFDYSKWNSLIDTPPFQKSIQQMKTVHDLMDPKHRGMTPREAEQAFRLQQSVLCLSWPHPVSEGSALEKGKLEGAEAHLIPGSSSKFDFSSGKWNRSPADERQVQMIGVGGFCASVVRSSPRSSVATRRLALISGKELSEPIGLANPESGFPYRASHLNRSSEWVSRKYDTPFVESFSKVIEKQFDATTWIVRPRVQKAEQYELAMANEIEAVFQGKSTAEATREISARCNQISESVDIEFQKQVNLESLGVK